jgi:hypothetical protein
VRAHSASSKLRFSSSGLPARPSPKPSSRWSPTIARCFRSGCEHEVPMPPQRDARRACSSLSGTRNDRKCWRNFQASFQDATRLGSLPGAKAPGYFQNPFSQMSLPAVPTGLRCPVSNSPARRWTPHPCSLLLSNRFSNIPGPSYFGRRRASARGCSLRIHR